MTAAIGQVRGIHRRRPRLRPAATQIAAERPGGADQRPAGRRPRPQPGPTAARAAAHRPRSRRVRRDRRQVLVGGTTAENVDYSDVINHWLPIVLAFVLGLSFILLTRRVPLRGHLRDRRGAQPALGRRGLRTAGAGLPAGVAAQACWASSRWSGSRPGCRSSCSRCCSHSRWTTTCSCSRRIRERYAQTGDTVDAVIHGIAATGRIITGAALIIVVVFAGFAAGRAGDVPADGLRRRRRTAGGRHADPNGRRAGGDEHSSADGTGTCRPG